MKKVSFTQAVDLYREWGFQVDPGPRHFEISLTLQSEDYTNYYAVPAAQLPAMATAALQVRLKNGFDGRDCPGRVFTTVH